MDRTPELEAVLSFPHPPCCPPFPKAKQELLHSLELERGTEDDDQQKETFEYPQRAEELCFGESYDLAKEAVALLDLLHQVDAAEDLALYSPAGMQVAMYRYERFWLPLLSRLRRSDIAPPLDVAWAWLMHSLAPSKYAADVQAILAAPAADLAVAGPLLRSSGAIRQGKEEWDVAYGAGSFEPPGAGQTARAGCAFDRSAFDAYVSSSASKISYNLVQAAARQQVFLYQVSLPHWRRDWFLRRGEGRYRCFLLLRKEHPSAFLVPTYDIDLMWHAHMASHSIYVEDLQRLTGGFFDHDDSINDRTQGSQLSNGFRSTSELWLEAFGTEYTFEGAMYRGRAPSEFLRAHSRSRGLAEETLLADTAVAPADVRKKMHSRKLRIVPTSSADYKDPEVSGRESTVTQHAVTEESHQGRGPIERGRVFVRRPCGIVSDQTLPAMVAVMDGQGKFTAVSRIIERAQLPVALQGQAGNLPVTNHRLDGPPSFLIQSCSCRGDADWGILQCHVDRQGEFQPKLYRLGSEFFSSHDASSKPIRDFSKQEYVGLMRVEMTEGSKFRSFQFQHSGDYLRQRELQDADRCSSKPRRKIFPFKLPFLPLGANGRVEHVKLEMSFGLNGAQSLSLSPLENEGCVAALSATLGLLLETYVAS